MIIFEITCACSRVTFRYFKHTWFCSVTACVKIAADEFLRLTRLAYMICNYIFYQNFICWLSSTFVNTFYLCILNTSFQASFKIFLTIFLLFCCLLQCSSQLSFPKRSDFDWSLLWKRFFDILFISLLTVVNVNELRWFNSRCKTLTYFLSAGFNFEWWKKEKSIAKRLEIDWNRNKAKTKRIAKSIGFNFTPSPSKSLHMRMSFSHCCRP